MTSENDKFQLPPGLINLPPEILERARATLPPGAGVEALTALVVEALDDFLNRREGAPEGRGEVRPQAINFLLSQVQPVAASQPRERRTIDQLRTRRVVAPAEEDRVTLEGIEDTEGSTREVLLRCYEEIDDLEATLRRAGRPEVAVQVLSQVTDWAGIDPVAGAPIRLDGEVPTPKEKKPIFGFHNRDYPSLWVLELLAKATPEGPVLWSEFALGLNVLARKFGGLLRELDRGSSGDSRPPRGLKFATAFPDPGKPNEASGGQWLLSSDGSRRDRLFPFVKNNFGSIQKAGGAAQAVGPLPQWGAVAFFPEGRDYRVGVTEQGLALLKITAGSSIDLPHPPGAARGFLDYLKANAPEDWQGLKRVTSAIAERPDREKLVLRNKDYFDSFRERPTDPDDLRFASSMTQGYVSRGREWGLVDPDLAPSTEGKKVLYQLTELGEEMVESNDWG